jgi:hypothetical protein
VYDGRIYTSSDSGDTWTPRESSRKWKSICSNSAGDRLAAVAYDDIIYTSGDYGVTWTQRATYKYWQSICSNSTGDRLAAFASAGSIYTSSVYYTYKNIPLEDMFAGGTDNLTNYTINGTVAKFLKAFYKDTDKNAVTDLKANASMFKYLGNEIEFCPAYVLHADTGTDIPIPSGVTKMFVVCIGGGGGGGGGGVAGPGYLGGSGGGGGGGALGGWFINFVSGQTTYNITIGNGGTYGRPNNDTTMDEGQIDSAGNYATGQDGTGGGNTTFTYTAGNYTVTGGSGGQGGIGGNPYTYTNKSAGGGGGTVTTSNSTYSKDGTGGSNGLADTTHGSSKYRPDGGVGGASGNKRGGSTRFLINNSVINVQPFTPFTRSGETAGYNDDRVCYGDGGRGGKGEGDSNDWSSAGYSGNKGCVIVFFYY